MGAPVNDALGVTFSAPAKTGHDMRAAANGMSGWTCVISL